MAEILFLTQVLPYPLDAGPKVRAYYMLRHLAARHRVTLVSFVRPDDRPESLAHLRHICAEVHVVPMRRSWWRNLHAGTRGLLTGLPIVVARDEIAEMGRLLHSLAGCLPFDVIHADQLSMAGWGRLAAAAVHPGARVAESRVPRTLLDEHNAIYSLTQRMAAEEQQPLRRLLIAREGHAFARYETSMCRAYDAVLTVTSEDREHLLALYDPAARAALAARFTVVPICVDPESVLPVPHRPGPPTILHLGTMFWPPNVAGVLWFAREVLPLVRRQIPDVRFVVVGKNPPPEIRALAANGPDRSPITVTGYVADPVPYLESADVFVVPLHSAGGMRVKILDAWSWGLPVIATPTGAEGLEVQDGENLLIAGDAVSFAAATVRLLQDEALNRHLRSVGRAWVEGRYGWQAVYRLVDEVYAGLLGDGPGRQN